MESTKEDGMCSITLLLTFDSYHSVQGQLLLLFIVMALAIFTTVSNIVIIHLTRSSSELKPLGPLRTFIGSMAYADLFMGIIVVPLCGHQYILKEWLLGHQGCKVFMCCSTLGGTASVLHLCVIAIDRYLAIIHPLVYKRVQVHSWYTLSMVIFVWVLSLAVAAQVYIFDLVQTWEEGARFHCDIPKSAPFAMLMTGLVFSIPNCIIWGIYLRIYCMSRSMLKERIRNTLKAYQHINRNTTNNKKRESNNSDYELSGLLLCMPHLQPTSYCISCQAKTISIALKSGMCKVCRAPNNLMAAALEARIKALMYTNRRSFLITLIITCAFTICYTPIGIRQQVAAICPECQMGCMLSNSLTWLVYANSALNPIIYTIFNNKFRQAFKKMIGC